MNYQIKVLRGLDQGNFAIIITRGHVDLAGFEYILDRVSDATQTLLDCKVLIDFQDAIFHFLPADVAKFLARFEFSKWPHSNRIALVSSPDMPQQYRQLAGLRDNLVEMKLEVGVFHDTRAAIDWLSGSK
jgi:hypothetical protein